MRLAPCRLFKLDFVLTFGANEQMIEELQLFHPDWTNGGSLIVPRVTHHIPSQLSEPLFSFRPPLRTRKVLSCTFFYFFPLLSRSLSLTSWLVIAQGSEAQLRLGGACAIKLISNLSNLCNNFLLNSHL